eukprot:TRINITY_DN512_c1_g1_i1.p1 TRINITY_DN512_c1_g1~~TRINITY_DN512_c1_g1_i1.p1  ORF type:complete len:1419 (-),score=427.30 TRINITY_DN512_c1_g1_i1:102-4358(-)
MLEWTLTDLNEVAKPEEEPVAAKAVVKASDATAAEEAEAAAKQEEQEEVVATRAEEAPAATARAEEEATATAVIEAEEAAAAKAEEEAAAAAVREAEDAAAAAKAEEEAAAARAEEEAEAAARAEEKAAAIRAVEEAAAAAAAAIRAAQLVTAAAEAEEEAAARRAAEEEAARKRAEEEEAAAKAAAEAAAAHRAELERLALVRAAEEAAAAARAEEEAAARRAAEAAAAIKRAEEEAAARKAAEEAAARAAIIRAAEEAEARRRAEEEAAAAAARAEEEAAARRVAEEAARKAAEEAAALARAEEEEAAAIRAYEEEKAAAAKAAEEAAAAARAEEAREAAALKAAEEAAAACKKDLAAAKSEKEALAVVGSFVAAAIAAEADEDFLMSSKVKMLPNHQRNLMSLVDDMSSQVDNIKSRIDAKERERSKSRYKKKQAAEVVSDVSLDVAEFFGPLLGSSRPSTYSNEGGLRLARSRTDRGEARQTVDSDEYLLVVTGEFQLQRHITEAPVRVQAGEGVFLKTGERLAWSWDKPVQYVTICLPTSLIKPASTETSVQADLKPRMVEIGVQTVGEPAPSPCNASNGGNFAGSLPSWPQHAHQQPGQLNSQQQARQQPTQQPAQLSWQQQVRQQPGQQPGQLLGQQPGQQPGKPAAALRERNQFDRIGPRKGEAQTGGYPTNMPKTHPRPASPTLMGQAPPMPERSASPTLMGQPSRTPARPASPTLMPQVNLNLSASPAGPERGAGPLIAGPTRGREKKVPQMGNGLVAGPLIKSSLNVAPSMASSVPTRAPTDTSSQQEWKSETSRSRRTETSCTRTASPNLVEGNWLANTGNFPEGNWLANTGNFPEDPSTPVFAAKGGELSRCASLSAFEQLMDNNERLKLRYEMEDMSIDRPARYGARHLSTPIVIVTSEINPWSKTGGLAMVTSSYAYEFAVRGHRTMAVAPRYGNYKDCHRVCAGKVWLDGKEHEVQYYHQRQEFGGGRGCDYIFVDHGSFHRPQGLYGDPTQGGEYQDNCFRFSLLTLAAAEAPLILNLGGSVYGQEVCFIANDWQTGMLPVYLLYKYKRNGVYLKARCMMVIHNMGYQGKYRRSSFPMEQFFGLPSEASKELEGEDMQFGKDCLNLLGAGIRLADRVLTVSPNYGYEIQTPEGGLGLHNMLKEKANQQRVKGILNGISDEWNPSTDPHIAVRYGINNFEEGKQQCKAALQRELGLHEDPNLCLLGFCGRLCHQKGIHLITESIPWLMENQGNGVNGFVQVVMMGKGETCYETALRQVEGNHRGRVCAFVGFDPQVEHRMMAGCDILLMPSQYEPCGLPQMYAQAYGTLPVVHATGGLKDSVKGFWNEHKDRLYATGFHFDGFDGNKLKERLYQAMDLYRNKGDVWRQLQLNAMKSDYYWPQAIDEYERSIDIVLEDRPYRQ